MAGVITLLSSDEESVEPTLKKQKICEESDSFLVISDEDEPVFNGNELKSEPAEVCQFKVSNNNKLIITTKIRDKEINSTVIDLLAENDETNCRRRASIEKEEASRLEKTEEHTVQNLNDFEVQDCSNIDVDEMNKEPLNNETENVFNTEVLDDEGNTSDEEEVFESDDISKFLTVCENSITNDKVKEVYLSKTVAFKKLLKKSKTYSSSSIFKELLAENIKLVAECPDKAVQCFTNLYAEVQSAYTNNTKNVDLTKRQKNHVKKLEIALYKLNKKIAKLEECDVDFDEEDDSAYLQCARYKERAAKVYKKYCEYTKNKPNLGHGRLDFADSKYGEFNKVINKKYRNHNSFPTYYDIDKLFRKCAQDNNMHISEEKMLHEIKFCFDKLGNLLQRKRKTDLFSMHMYYLNRLAEDPAKTDVELDKKLKEQFELGHSKINEICQKYVVMQELGRNPDMSSDSDDSSRKSESEENDS